MVAIYRAINPLSCIQWRQDNHALIFFLLLSSQYMMLLFSHNRYLAVLSRVRCACVDRYTLPTTEDGEPCLPMDIEGDNKFEDGNNR